MNTLSAVQQRLQELIDKHHTNVNALSNAAGVSQSTVKSILNNESENPGIVTLKKILDGFQDPPESLYDFFNTDIFRSLEQEIK
ncbi:helix-turn-helix transcriptional regulator [Christensenellaceae bacterium OttesenSCG-928-M15]|nr:helix-turn-helix transcriptional regulator [Christensenellaceae bacterium OttesenSCG-928-M15]